jgi:alkanesulfonate monooxygenase
MTLELIGMVGTRDASEIKGPLVDGPVVDWSDGPVVDPSYLRDISVAHERSGFDRALVGYGAVGPEGWAVAASVLHATSRLGVLVAHRPGLVAPMVLARMASTLDQLTGGGRVALHLITGGDEADQRREGDFVSHDERYRRTAELMGLLRRVWGADEPFDHRGEFYRLDAAFNSVKPVTELPLYFAGASEPAVAAGAAQADVYAFWGEPLAAVAARKATIDRAAARLGRRLRYSISLRPVVAATEQEAWDRAEWIASETAARIALAKERIASASGGYTGLGGQGHETYSLRRDEQTTSSEGRKRLIRLSAERDVHDERLWMKVAALTGAAGNSTAVVGTAEQVAEALLRYYDLGVTTLLLKGFDPLDDAVAFGDELVPLLREGAARREALRRAPDPI